MNSYWNINNIRNRPATLTQGTTVIECKYDAQGRRFEKKVTANGTVTLWQRYAYKGYLQIAAFNASSVDDAEVLSLATTTYWDPTEPTATRPLAFTDHAGETPATYFYTHDLTKNVCEVLSRNGSAVEIVTEYDYTPFGAVTASNSATPNTFMFSSEVLDPETSLVYYNYRHYNPLDGRWINRDPVEEDGGENLFVIVYNRPIFLSDYLGYEFINQGKLKEDFYVHLRYQEGHKYRGGTGLQESGSIQKEISPIIEGEGCRCWVKEGTGFFIVERGYIGIKSGFQGIPQKAEIAGRKEKKYYEKYIFSDTAKIINEHEEEHIRMSQLIYNETLAILELIVDNHRDEEHALRIMGCNVNCFEICKESLLYLINWENNKKNFISRDQNANMQMGEIDTAVR